MERVPISVILLLASIAVLAILSQPRISPVEAATIDKVNRGECSIVFSGDVAQGDLERLKQMQDDYFQSICLNSRGGSYPEAIKIVKLLIEHRATTVVDAGDVCLSACAIIFMAGTSEGEAPGPQRRLHVRGTLGFHAPYLIDKNEIQAREREAYFDSAVQAIGRLIALAPRIDFSIRLIGEMLSRKREDMFLIDTIWKAEFYRIEIFGNENRHNLSFPSLTKQSFGTACEKIYLLSEGFSDISEDKCYECRMDAANTFKIDREQGTGKSESFLVAISEPDKDGLEERWSGSCKLRVVTEAGIVQSVEWAVQPGEGASKVSTVRTTNSSSLLLLPKDTPLATIGSAVVPAPPTVAAVTPNAPLALLWNKHDLAGGDLQAVKDMDGRACNATCASSEICVAFSYDKWNRWCFLKSSLGVLRFDPQSVSGMKSGAGTPVRSLAPLSMQRYRGKIFPKAAGETTVASPTLEACEKQCLHSQECVAVTFLKSSRQCRLIADAGEYSSDRAADSSVKRQAAFR